MVFNASGMAEQSDDDFLDNLFDDYLESEQTEAELNAFHDDMDFWDEADEHWLAEMENEDVDLEDYKI